MIVKLLTEQYLEFLSLTGGCTGSNESTLVKIPHCWKSHVAAQNFIIMSPPSGSGGILVYTARLSVRLTVRQISVSTPVNATPPTI